MRQVMGNANISAMFDKAGLHSYKLILLSTLCLSGCQFFITPPQPEPDPATDGVLSCGEMMSVDGVEPGSSVPLDLPVGSSLEVLLEFDEPNQLARLRTESESTLERALPVFDPVQGIEIIPGFRAQGESLDLELLGAGEAGFLGSISMRCFNPGEICFNLSDDDNDGLIDCADIHCAREPRCADDQNNLEEIQLDCSETPQQLEPATLRSFDDQRTLYLQEGRTSHEFWGGAELVLEQPLQPGTIELSFGEAGMACSGSPEGQSISCSLYTEIEAGEVYSFTSDQLPLYLEPLAPSWIDIRAQLVCD